MFKKAKRANFRRRNESDEDEQEESQQPQLAPTMFGPSEIPFMETSNSNATGVLSTTESCHSNGLQANSVRAVKKEKKVKDTTAVPGPTKASLLSFVDEEGNFGSQTDAKLASLFTLAGESVVVLSMIVIKQFLHILRKLHFYSRHCRGKKVIDHQANMQVVHG